MTRTLVEFLRARYDDDERTYNYLNDMGEQGPYYFLLDDLAAKRRIIDLHSGDHECSVYDHHGDVDNFAWVTGSACSTMCLLALPYADHADYRQEWRP